MKILLSESPGNASTLVLRDVPMPEPKAGEVLIEVHATGMNYFDGLMIEDKYQFKPPRPFAPGSEIAGIISAIGEGVAGFGIGERIFANLGHGGLAQFIAVDAKQISKISENMPFDVAAGTFITYGTSLHALKDRAQLKAGETLLVLGAAGGVGLAAVELGAAMGANVIAAVSSQEKLDIAMAHGASGGFIYPSGPFDGDGKKELSALFKAHGGKGGYDVIYDAVGGDYNEAALRAIAWYGRLLVVGFVAGIPKTPLNLTLLKSCQIIGVFWGAFVAREPKIHAQNCAMIEEFYQNGKIKPLIRQKFSLEDGAKAIEHLQSRKALGKVIVAVK